MDRFRSFASFTAAALVVVLGMLPATAAAAQVNVDCARGNTISKALAAHPSAPDLVLVVSGTCTENVVVTRDNVAMTTNGSSTASGLRTRSGMGRVGERVLCARRNPASEPL